MAYLCGFNRDERLEIGDWRLEIVLLRRSLVPFTFWPVEDSADILWSASGMQRARKRVACKHTNKMTIAEKHYGNLLPMSCHPIRLQWCLHSPLCLQHRLYCFHNRLRGMEATLFKRCCWLLFGPRNWEGDEAPPELIKYEEGWSTTELKAVRLGLEARGRIYIEKEERKYINVPLP